MAGRLGLGLCNFLLVFIASQPKKYIYIMIRFENKIYPHKNIKNMQNTQYKDKR